MLEKSLPLAEFMLYVDTDGVWSLYQSSPTARVRNSENGAAVRQASVYMSMKPGETTSS